MSKTALGKGLGAIFGDKKDFVEKVEKIEKLENSEIKNEIKLSKITVNPFQPRKTFDESKLKELTESIKENGIIQPLIVRSKGRTYEIVAGERRFRAASRLGLVTVPAIVRDYNDEQMMEIAMIENIERHDLNPIEEAEGIKNIMEAMNLTQEEVAKKLSRSRTAIANMLRLLKLPSVIRNNVVKGELSIGQVRPLLGLKSVREQKELAKYILELGLSARIVEDILKKVRDGYNLDDLLNPPELVKTSIETKDEKVKTKKKNKKELGVYLREYQEKLVESLGTKVRLVKKNEKAGKIEIEYYSQEDLERIYELISKKEEIQMKEKISKKTIKKFNV